MKKFLGKPEEAGENWGHIMAANEEDVYNGEFRYEIPGYNDKEVADLLESKKN